MKTKKRIATNAEPGARAHFLSESKTVKNKRINTTLVWKQFEDVVVQRLRFSVTDRAVYSYLFRHSRLERKLQIRFTLSWLAHGIRLCTTVARESVRRLIELGVLRLVERSKTGHLVEVRLPEEIPLPRQDAVVARTVEPGNSPEPVNIDEIDFLQNTELRRAIHARERGRCFYCLRQTSGRTRCLDHVVPRALLGGNSYRNLVSCCQECNPRKGDQSAENFLCGFYREGRLTAAQLAGRLRALEALASGKLRPALASVANPLLAKTSRSS